MPEDERQVYIAGETQKWFTMIPNMVDDMRLDPYAYRLYGHIRRVAGEGGKCYQSTRFLAEHCQMSAAKVSEAKQTLKNVGLIEVSRTWIGEGKIGRDHIRVTDIWKRNFERYGTEPKPQENPVIAVRTQEDETVIAVRTQGDHSQGEHKSDRCAKPKEKPVLKKNPVGGEVPSKQELARIWNDAKTVLEPTIGAGAFAWLREARLQSVSPDGEAVIAVTSPEAQQMCEARLRRPVGEVLEQMGLEAAATFVFDQERAPSAPPAPGVPGGGALTTLWKQVLRALREQDIPVTELRTGRIQAVERVDDRCHRAVIVTPKRIDPNCYALPVATALKAATGQEYVTSFLTG